MADLMVIKGVECYTDENGTIMLNLEHVARGLGFTQTQNKNGKEYVSIRWERIENYLKDFGYISSPTSGGKIKYIPEPIFYLLAMKADNQTAREFQNMVAYEILPTIRKHGMYAVDELLDNPDLFIQVITELKKEREEKKRLQGENAILEQRVAEYEPKVTYYDTILQSQDVVNISQISKDYGLTANELNKILEEEKVQYKNNGQWLLYKDYMNNGLTKSCTFPYTHSDGSKGSRMHTKWTQKGRLMIHSLLEKRGIMADMDKEDEE